MRGNVTSSRGALQAAFGFTLGLVHNNHWSTSVSCPDLWLFSRRINGGKAVNHHLISSNLPFADRNLQENRPPPVAFWPHNTHAVMHAGVWGWWRLGGLHSPPEWSVPINLAHLSSHAWRSHWYTLGRKRRLGSLHQRGYCGIDSTCEVYY